MLITTDFVVQICCNSGCGIAFAVPADWDKRKRNDHTIMWCPNGHQQSYRGESEEEILKRRLAQAQTNALFYEKQRNSERESHQHTKNRLNATRGVVTRVKRRIGKGVCPCCNRHFSNVEAHMETKHKGYHAEAAE